MKVAVGADHGGYELKEWVKTLLDELGHQVDDAGCYSPDSVDYPDIVSEVSRKLLKGECETGILICGTGIGVSMAANRDPRIRAAVCHNEYTAKMSREHNDANILCIGARVIGAGVLEDIVRLWLETEFAGGRHQRRIDKYSESI